jgi:superfamily II DNA or RNA helicase
VRLNSATEQFNLQRSLIRYKTMNELLFEQNTPPTNPRDYDSYLVKPTIKERFSYFDEYRKLNREHQNAALTAAQTSATGQINSPCGTGKTRIQICLHVASLIELSIQKKSGITVIASHRLALNRQLCDELVNVIVRCGLSFDILCIGSDRLETKKYYLKYAKQFGYTPETSRHLGSLNQKEIEKFIEQSRILGRHVLVVSTYNSIDRLQNVGVINLMTHDEAHNIVREDFTNNINLVKQNVIREYFFTATRKIRGKYDGMNNTEFYGEVLIDILAQDMLNKGEIACPRIHFITGKNEETTSAYNTHMLVKNTIEAFEKHRKIINENLMQHDEIGAKIIVGCISIQDMDDIFNYPEFKDWAKKSNVKCFTISSKGGNECYINWIKVSKEEFFLELKNLSDPEDALIFNVDMLSEGIDLPTITGVMPMRNLDEIKLIQLFGRALRLIKRDRDRLYSGEINPSDYSKYIKPYGYIIFPRHLNSCNEFKRMEEIVNRIYAEYGTPFEQLVIQDKYIDTVPNDLDSMIQRDLDSNKDYALQHKMADVVSNIYIDIFEKMSAEDRKQFLIGDDSLEEIIPQ